MIVLLVIVDSNYKFIAIWFVGSFGRGEDSGIFLILFLGKQILNDSFNYPKESALPEIAKVVSYVIFSDQEFINIF